MPKRLTDCVKAIKARGGKSAKYAWAICVSSTKLKPHKKSKSTKHKGR